MGAPAAGGQPLGSFPAALARTRSSMATVPCHPRLCMPVLPPQSQVHEENPPILSPPASHRHPHCCHHCMPGCWSRRRARRGLEGPDLQCSEFDLIHFPLSLQERAMALMPAGLGRSPSARQEGKPPLSVPAHPHWRKGRTRLGRWRSLGIA